MNVRVNVLPPSLTVARTRTERSLLTRLVAARERRTVTLTRPLRPTVKERVPSFSTLLRVAAATARVEAKVTMPLSPGVARKPNAKARPRETVMVDGLANVTLGTGGVVNVRSAPSERVRCRSARDRACYRRHARDGRPR